VFGEDEEDAVAAFLAECTFDDDASVLPPLELTKSFVASAAAAVEPQVDGSLDMGHASTAAFLTGCRAEGGGEVHFQATAGSTPGPMLLEQMQQQQQAHQTLPPLLGEAAGGGEHMYRSPQALSPGVRTAATSGSAEVSVVGQAGQEELTWLRAAAPVYAIAGPAPAPEGVAGRQAAPLVMAAPPSVSQPPSVWGGAGASGNADMAPSVAAWVAADAHQQQQIQGVYQVPQQDVLGAAAVYGSGVSIQRTAAASSGAACDHTGYQSPLEAFLAGSHTQITDDGIERRSSLDESLVHLLNSSSDALGTFDNIWEVEQEHHNMERLQAQVSSMCKEVLEKYLQEMV
jgi:hypothetical protein